jgi:hypothetical protein
MCAGVLEVVNCLLSAAEVPGLFNSEELSKDLAALDSKRDKDAHYQVCCPSSLCLVVHCNPPGEAAKSCSSNRASCVATALEQRLSTVQCSTVQCSTVQYSTVVGCGGPSLPQGSLGLERNKATFLNILVHCLHMQGLPSSYAYFTACLQRNLRVAISLDPAHEAFSRRLEQNPALISCCSMLWWQGWSESSLRTMAMARLKVSAVGSPCWAECTLLR